MDLEATFQQFCCTREPAALGAVFDATADDLFAPGWLGATDGDGWRTFDDVEPVPLRVLAWATREAGLLQVAPIEQPIVVRPGQESEVVVVLAQ